MLKKMCALLLVLFAFSTAAVVDTNLTTFAYSPFPTEGLGSWVNSVDTVSKYSFAPSTVYYKGAFHQFYCSTGNATDNFFNPTQNLNLYKAYDHIRYRTSKDGYNWSTPRVVMTVNKNDAEKCACDPSVVYGDDGYWYMLYDGNSSKYGVVVFLARSLFIQGPYFRYLGNNKWEGEDSGDPQIVLRSEETNKDGVVGQQTVVKVPNGPFYVWFRDTYHRIRFTSVNKLTDLVDVRVSATPLACYMDGDICRTFQPFYEIGDVRFNKVRNYWEMWTMRGLVEENSYVAKFISYNGVFWYLDVKLKPNGDFDYLNPYSIGPYNFIHDIGVSGDEHGWITDSVYLVSFSAPHPGTEKASVALQLTEAQLTPNSNEYIGYGYDIKTQRDTSKHRLLIGEWSMWQQLVGGTCRLDTIIYPDTGFVFPKGVKSKNLEYFTGDFDGDGISDLGAVRISNRRWYVRSGRTGKYIWNGKILIDSLNSNFVVVTGDYDGDGKTDIGAVDMSTGRWYIRSSEKNQNGINQYSPSSPNYIPWGWMWPGMTSDHKIVVGDYDGDGIADRAIYKAPNWYIISSMATAAKVADPVISTSGATYIPWGWSWPGMNNDHVAVSGDFDGDGVTDRAIYGDTKWYVLSSRLGEAPLAWRWNVAMFGTTFEKKQIWEHMFAYDRGAKPYAGDYDGDGVADLVQVSASKGMWRIYGSLVRHTVETWNRLKNAKDPVILVGDFDGDGMADKAFVDRNNQHFYVISSRSKLEGVNVEIKSIKELMKEKSLKKEGSHGQEGPKPETPVSKVPPVNVSVVNRDVTVANVPNGAKVVVFDLNGKNVFDAVSNGNSVNFQLPSYGKFIVRAGAMTRMVVAK